MWIPQDVLGIESDFLHERLDHIPALTPPGRAKDDHRLGNDVPDRHARIERGVRILKDYLKVLPGFAEDSPFDFAHIVMQGLAGPRIRHTQVDAAGIHGYQSKNSTGRR